MSDACAPSDPVAELYRGHHGWLHGWLRRKLGCTHNAADLAQDTFVRVIRARTAQEEDGASAAAPAEIRDPRAYLATIANGLVVDFFRRQSLERAYLEVLARLPEPQVPSPEARALILEALAEIDAMLAGMGPKVREAFLLSQLEGLTYAEIARRLGISLRTVNNYMVKATLHCASHCAAVLP